MLGTPAFMAPEQAAGKLDQIDALTDIWAVGATMFQLLTGRLVHEATTPNAAIVAAATIPVAPIRSLCPELSAELAHVVDRSLAFDREDRWPNAYAMRRALLQTTPGVVAPAPRSGKEAPITIADVETPTGPLPKRRTSRALLAGLALAAVLGAAWLLGRPESGAAADATRQPTKPSQEPARPAPESKVATRAPTATGKTNVTEVEAPPEKPRLHQEPTTASPRPKGRASGAEDEALIETRH
jgi:serine/threonine-protein kinase